MSKNVAAVAEAAGEAIDVEYDGAVYTVPTPLDWPLDVMDLLAEGKFTESLRALLGDAQYEAFKSGKTRRVRDAVAFWEAISEASGTETAGN